MLMPMLMRRGIKKYLGHFNFDLILFEAPPVTNSSLIKWAKRHFDCKSYLMLKDIFPQNAVDLGIIKTNSFLYRYFLLKERLLFENTDYIGCMSYANKQYILRNSDYLDPDKVEIFPNTKKITRDYNCVSFPMREMLEIPSTSCVFLFGGDMGRPQYVELLCSAIKHFKDNCNVFFLFVGRGTEKHRIAKTIENYKVDNAIILDDLPREKYEQINKECDVGLIVLDPRFTIPNYPSRILSYMEYAKPVLAATDNVTDIRNLIEEVDCGYWVWSGDEQGFLLAIEDILVDKELVQKGIKGRKYIEEKLKVEHCVQILESHFESNKE
ncbi:MAG: glycosyltransferase family 4 protein [Erysipelothrix sp.]|nr:glycosyltransferase family 4 protein [Erysipelothrix sp.]